MTVKEFDICMAFAESSRSLAKSFRDKADQYEAWAIQEAGVECVEREAGFACWRLTSFPDRGYFNTPREALRALNGGADD